MRILICAQQAPLPPTNGFVLQVAAVLAQLRREHDVRVVALRFPHQEASGATADGVRLVRVPPRLAGTGAVGRAVAAARGRPPLFHELASRVVEPLEDELQRFRPHVVHVAGAMLASLGGRLAGRAAVLAPLDAAHLNAEARAARSPGARGWLARREVTVIRGYEATEYRRFRRVVVVGEADRAALKALDPHVRAEVIGNGVDADAFDARAGTAPVRDRVIFAGVMNAAPNVSAAVFLARDVMPRVRACVPAARLAIVGRAPVREVRWLGRLGGVEVVGEVDDMWAWLASSRVAIAPMVSGTGVKNKVLEAMAAGVPCVVTPRALNGLRAVPGRHLLVGSGPAELASAIVHLLTDDCAAAELGAAGREYVLAEHSWRDVGEAYVRLYESVIAEARLDGVATGRPATYAATGRRRPESVRR